MDMADQNQSFAEHLIASATGKFRWPSNAILYCLPPERELIVDRARRLMWESYLQMAQLTFISHTAPNADYMSPSGRAPFIYLKLGSQSMIFSNFDKMVSFLQAQNLALGSQLKAEEKANMEAYISLVNTKVLPAMEYQTWLNAKNVREHTIATHGYSLSWPLSVVVPRLQQARFIWNNCYMYRRSQREVLLDFEQAASAVSTRLGAGETFFSCGPSTLDAVVYGHFQAVMSTALPSSELARVLLQFNNLREYCSRTLPDKGLVERQDIHVADKSFTSSSAMHNVSQHEC